MGPGDPLSSVRLKKPYVMLLSSYWQKIDLALVVACFSVSGLTSCRLVVGPGGPGGPGGPEILRPS